MKVQATSDASGKISRMRWLKKRSEATEARKRLVHEELRQSVLQLMSDYDCQVKQGDDWLEVRGGARACPFRIDLPGDEALLDAGDEGEYVLEWVLSMPGELKALVGLLRRIVAGDLADLPAGLNNRRLEGYSGYVPLAPPKRSL